MKSFFNKKKKNQTLQQQPLDLTKINTKKEMELIPTLKVEYIGDYLLQVSNLCNVLFNTKQFYYFETTRDVQNIYNEHHELSSSNYNNTFKENFENLTISQLSTIYSTMPVCISMSIPYNKNNSIEYLTKNSLCVLFQSLAQQAGFMLNYNTVQDKSTKITMVGSILSAINFKKSIYDLEDIAKDIYSFLDFIPDDIKSLPNLRSYKSVLEQSVPSDMSQIITYSNERKCEVSTSFDANKYNIIYLFNMGDLVYNLDEYFKYESEFIKVVEYKENIHSIIIARNNLLYIYLNFIANHDRNVNYQLKNFINDILLPYCKEEENVKNNNDTNHYSNQEEDYSFIPGVDEILD